MKALIVKLYRIIYHYTGVRSFSYIFSLSYITMLNLVTIYGLALLLEDWLPTAMVVKLFSFPMILITATGMLVVNYFTGPSVYYITSSEKLNKVNYTSVILYSAVTLLLFAYTQYADKIF